MMNVNFRSIGPKVSEDALVKHANWLAKPRNMNYRIPAGYSNEKREPPKGYENYVCLDVLGEEFLWLNEHFPKSQYTWYLWFESVFLVTPEMELIFKLRWG